MLRIIACLFFALVFTPSLGDCSQDGAMVSAAQCADLQNPSATKEQIINFIDEAEAQMKESNGDPRTIASGAALRKCVSQLKEKLDRMQARSK
jgi:hypothetical protein